MTCFVSLLVGIAVGVIYALLGVKSPAPPVVALFGLLGILIGEQGLPWVKKRVATWHAPASSPVAPARPGEPR